MSAENTRTIRGSASLASGRVLGIALSLVIQVALVRALSRDEFGAFGLALSIASLGFQAVTLGTTRAVPRFLGMFDESGDDRRFAGTLVFESALIAGLGLVIVVVTIVLRLTVGSSILDDELAFTLTAILIITAPQEAFDKLLEAVAATFGDSRTILLRKHVLEPGLRLAAVMALLSLGQGPIFLAIAYVGAGLVGTVLYLRATLPHLRGKYAAFREGAVIPGRDIFRFSLPLLSHDLVFVAINTLAAVVLARVSLEAVADYRAVFPLARMNQVVGWTFAVLFMPLAARHFARKDVAAMSDAYWRSASWLTVLTLPIALVTTAFADPVVPDLFGEEYRQAIPVLVVLSSAYYLNQTFGFNTLTLQTFGHLRWTVGVDIVAIVIYVIAAMLLARRFEAVGVAVAGAIALTVLNVGAQVRLSALGMARVDRQFLWVWVAALLGLGVGWLVSVAIEPGLIAAIGVSGVISLAVIVVNRRRLDVLETFPFIARVRPLARILGG